MKHKGAELKALIQVVLLAARLLNRAHGSYGMLRARNALATTKGTKRICHSEKKSSTLSLVTASQCH